MSYIDLQATLRDWPYDPDKISVRKILSADGAVRIQMRVELGIVQMEGTGRPDGTRPHGCESLLAHHQTRLARHLEGNGTSLGFSLEAADCEALRLEASQYYRRYVAFFVLEEFDSVVRDTAHSLKIFDLCRDYAMDPRDRKGLEDFRPYVLMMHARGLAYASAQKGEPDSALAHVNRGVLAIRAHFEAGNQPEGAAGCEEIRLLRALGKELSVKAPHDSIVVARKALRVAIEQERFEEAARLRDELNSLYTRKAL